VVFLNMTTLVVLSAQRLFESKRFGVHQIASACDDDFAAAKNIDSEKADMPQNYYRDIRSRALVCLQT